MTRICSVFFAVQVEVCKRDLPWQLEELELAAALVEKEDRSNPEGNHPESFDGHNQLRNENDDDDHGDGDNDDEDDDDDDDDHDDDDDDDDDDDGDNDDDDNDDDNDDTDNDDEGNDIQSEHVHGDPKGDENQFEQTRKFVSDSGLASELCLRLELTKSVPQKDDLFYSENVVTSQSMKH